MMSKIRSKWHFLWIAGFLCLAMGKAYELFYQTLEHTEGHRYQTIANANIQNLQKEIDQFAKLLPNELKRNAKTESEIFNIIRNYFSENPTSHHFILCDQNKLIYWNNSGLYNINWCPCEQNTGQGIFLQEGYYYYGIKSKFDSGENSYCSIFYTKILPEFVETRKISLHDNSKAKKQLQIQDIAKKPISYFENFNSNLAGSKANFLILFYFLVLFLFYKPFHQYTKHFLHYKNYSWALLTLSTGIVLLISLSQWIVSDHLFYNSFFTLKLIHTNWFKYTLFEFLILSLLIFHVAYIFHKYYSLNSNYVLTQKHEKYIIPFLNYFIIFLSLLVYCAAYKAVFVKSEFAFDFGNILNSPAENYLLLLCLLFILVSIFLISNKLVQSTLSFQLSLQERLLVFSASFILFALCFSRIELDISIISFFLASAIVIWLQDYFADEYQVNILWLITWIILISFLSSGLIFHYQNIKKRDFEYKTYKDFSNQLSVQNDSIQSIAVSDLIHKASTNAYQLYYYEDGILKYASDIKRPDLSSIQENIGKETYGRFVDATKDGLLGKVGKNKIVILAHSKDRIINAISLFSYIFTILILFSYFVNLVNNRYNFLPQGIHFSLSNKPSLRTKIQFYIILGIVLSFVIIAAVTVFFTKRTDYQLEYENVYYKAKSISSYLEKNIQEPLNEYDTKIIIQEKLKQAQNLLDYEIELYDHNGSKISQKSVFEPNANIVKLCNPEFYFGFPQDIEDIIILNDKNVDQNKNSLSAYRNLFQNNQRQFTLKVSQFQNTGNNSNNRLAILINTLLNIYVFLFLIAASLATFLANSITSPLEILRNKLKEIRLGKTNETLEYPGQDEIGELIQDYNNMVGQLDESATLLAKSERDSAWREMAKQVAHEIKNPLTPMKLSIQYLQQMIRSKSDNVPEMVEKVSNTILEQIDGLTKIATEFSNFAQMPKAENEKLLLNDIVSSVHDLFRKREDIDINLFVSIEEQYVYMDKNQIIRVLNNLINNAIQAIPEDRRGKIEISLEQKNKYTLIKIKDNGVGIPEAMQEKVFLPNFTTKNSGTGLGLAMCQQIIELSNGKLYFTSVENIGTIFFVELPLIKSN
ncbi:MAG: HAMP domain-containing histidine kinase [Saprospiraceae bacterium]|nr:HAMP domain-containing histidine kinase [Saprospiraceae bacterium]